MRAWSGARAVRVRVRQREGGATAVLLLRGGVVHGEEGEGGEGTVSSCVQLREGGATVV